MLLTTFRGNRHNFLKYDISFIFIVTITIWYYKCHGVAGPLPLDTGDHGRTETKVVFTKCTRHPSLLDLSDTFVAIF